MSTLVYDTPTPTTEAGAADYFFTDLAILILEPFENLLTKYGIKLPDDQRTGNDDEAAIYGEDYYNLGTFRANPRHFNGGIQRETFRKLRCPRLQSWE